MSRGSKSLSVRNWMNTATCATRFDAMATHLNSGHVVACDGFGHRFVIHSLPSGSLLTNTRLSSLLLLQTLTLNVHAGGIQSFCIWARSRSLY